MGNSQLKAMFLVCLFTFKCDIAAVVAIHLELKMFLEISGAASKVQSKN